MVMPMGVYANPRNDIAFKKLFADQKHETILLDFLNDVLEHKNITRIESVTIAEPNNLPLALGLKLSIVDVRCFDNKDKNYQIEMQVASQQDYAERCQFYTSYFIAKQLEKGIKYKKLEPIIFISIVNFKLFDHNRFLSHHVTTDVEDHKQYLKLIEHHFLELPKFKKNEKELKDPIDRWAYFFKNAEKCNELPSTMTNDTVMSEAFNVMSRASWSPIDLDRYLVALDAELSGQSQLETAHDEGEKKGIEKGIRAVALNLLGQKIDIETISKSTGLSIEEIKKLKNEAK